LKQRSLFEKLMGAEAKAELLMVFHDEPEITDTLEGLAKRINKDVKTVKDDVEDLAELGLPTEVKLYSFNREKDLGLQGEISSQLADGIVLAEREGIPTERFRTCVSVIDDLMIDGYPASSAVLALGDPDAGKATFCQQLTGERLKRGECGVYVILDNFPENIRLSMMRMGVDIKTYERQGKFTFIDCYSQHVGTKSSEKYSEDPANISNLSITISKALSEQSKVGPIVLILDSFSTLIQRSGVRASLEFFRSLIGKLRTVESTSLFLLNRRAFHPAILAATQDIADGVVEMKIEEEPSGLLNYLRITKMRGARHSTAWAPYEILPDRGLVRKSRT
jgi:KaiC/GvpD/RAD55 family RecA-like ATPase